MKAWFMHVLFVGCCGVLNAGDRKLHVAKEPITPRAAQKTKLAQEIQLHELRLGVLKSSSATLPQHRLRAMQEKNSRESILLFLRSAQARLANGRVLT